MSKKRDWKGSEQIPRTPDQRKNIQEYEAMSPEEKKVAHRKQFISWLEWLQKPGPKIMINGKPPKSEYIPMTREQAELHLAAFDGDIPRTKEQRLGIYLMDRASATLDTES